jgi:enhancing lycopene biosynthesis protein 2
MDGSEIHEAVCTLLELAQAQAQAICIAPNTDQMHVVDHTAGEPTSESRNVLTESARIARGEIRDVREIRADDLDALILPGGFGAAKNLCDFATAGVECTVHPEVERLLLEMHAASKPIGAICIAPALVARVFGKADKKVRLTIGSDADTAGKINAMGATHVTRKVEEVEIDRDNKIVSTPAYMLGPTIADVAKGIGACVREVLKLTG